MQSANASAAVREEKDACAPPPPASREVPNEPTPIDKGAGDRAAPRAVNGSTIDMLQTRETRADLRREALEAGPERENHLASHPLFKKPLKILTRSIQESFLMTNGVFKFMRPGWYVTADFRSGKSTALEMIEEQLPTVLPNVAVTRVSAKRRDDVTDKTFWGDLLKSMRLSTSGTAAEREDRVIGACVGACMSVNGKNFAMLIDEGQSWGAKEYTSIRNLGNELSLAHHITLTTLIWGDENLTERANSFRGRRNDLLGRFLLTGSKFVGIRDLEDLKFYLAEYDSPKRCEYPAGSGISYTEFFLPKAFAAGWRLENEVNNLWDAFVRAAAAINKSVNGIGMQWVSETVFNVLLSKTQADSKYLKMEPKDWDDAVAEAKYVASIC